MSDPVSYPDVEVLVKDYLAAALPDYVGDVTVGVGVPSDWKKSSLPHVQVASDGFVRFDHRCVARAQIRLVAWSTSTSASKALAVAALAVLESHPGGGGVASVQPFTGALPARDDATGAELASCSARVIVRSIPLEPFGS